MPVNNLIQLRKGNSSTWSSQNPILASGEPGYDLTNNILKIGDGITNWNNLTGIYPDLNTSLSSGSGIIFSYADSTLTISTSGFLTNIVEDLTPQLGGNLDLNSYSINGTGNVSISGNIIANTGNLDVLSFNINNESILTKGQLSWDDTEGTLGIGLTDNTTIHIGEHRYFRIRNETGGTLYKGQVVYASGVHANGIIEPALYVADGTVREVRFMGVVLENVNHNNNGYAIDFGHLENMDLDGSATNYAVGDETWSAGDILYVHPTVAGKLTNNEPKHSIAVAIILDAGNGNGNGRMFVRSTSYGHLDDNHDVDVSGATNGQFLQYNSATDYWVPSSSGNFTTLQLNGTTVSVSGHTHVSSDITNFNSSVSGLLPTIANSGDNRILTSTGSTVGINAESNLTFNGSTLGVVGGGSFSSQTVFASGTAAAPGISILGDTDTGLCQISSVGTNSLSISTSGVERVRFTSDGTTQVRANSSNISTLFTYNENGGELVHYDDAQAAATLLDQCNNQTRLLELINGSDLLLGLGGSNTTGSVRFMRAGFSEIMRINSSGNIGIGSSTNNDNIRTRLQVCGPDADDDPSLGSGTGALLVTNSDNTYGIQFGVSADGVGWIQQGRVDGTATAYSLLLNPVGGNVGIGTSSPQQKFVVSNAGAEGMEIIPALNANESRIQTYNRSTSAWNKFSINCGTFELFTNGGTTTIFGNTSGNVGIGTSSPSTKLQINGQTRVTDGTTNIDFVSSSAVGYIGTQTNHTLVLRTNDTERIRITADGNVGIGGTGAATPPELLSVMQDNNGGRTSILIDNLDQRLKMSCYYQAGVGQYAEIQGFDNAETGYHNIVLQRQGGEVLIGTATDNGAYKLQVNSQIYATNATIATSDARFKTNIVSINNATSIIHSLRPVSFDFIPQTDRNFSTDRQIGLIAQEVAEALSNIDYKDSIVARCGDHFGLAYEKLVPLLIKALQETNQELQNIKNRLSVLEGE